jgi:hypothetical protein
VIGTKYLRRLLGYKLGYIIAQGVDTPAMEVHDDSGAASPVSSLFRAPDWAMTNSTAGTQAKGIF